MLKAGNNSLEIWAAKLRLLLIYENMLKSITTTRIECTAKQENKMSYNTDYILPDFIDFFGDNWKEIKTQTEKGNIHNCKKYFTEYRLKIGLLFSNFWKFSKDHTEKWCSAHLYFLLKTKVNFTTFRTF